MFLSLIQEKDHTECYVDTFTGIFELDIKETTKDGLLIDEESWRNGEQNISVYLCSQLQTREKRSGRFFHIKINCSVTMMIRNKYLVFVHVHSLILKSRSYTTICIFLIFIYFLRHHNLKQYKLQV